MDNLKPLFAVAVCIISFHSAQTQNVLMAHFPGPNIEVGSTAYFYCAGRDITGWYKKQANGDYNIIPHGGRFKVLNDGVTYANLTIMDVVKNDTGVYLCKHNRFYSLYCELTVYQVRDVVISPEEPDFIEGQNLLLNCTVDGTTDQTVTWSVDKAGTPEDLTGGDDTSHVQIFNNGSIIVRALTPEDAGVYICTHVFNEASESAMVNVTVSPPESQVTPTVSLPESQVSPTVSPTESPTGGAVTFSMSLWRFLTPLFLLYALLN